MTRWRLVSAAVAVVVASLTVWWYINTFAEGVAEIGGRDLPMTVAVVDAETKLPIAGALVRIHYRYAEEELAQGNSEGRTDAAGKVILAPQLFWTSQVKWHRRHGWIRFWDKGITVKSAGYEPFKRELEAFAGRARPLSDDSPLSFVVEMKRAQ